MQFGRFLGKALLILGAILILSGLIVRNATGFTFGVFAAGPAIALIGIAMQFFPGGNVDPIQTHSGNFNFRTFLSNASLQHKLIWLAAGLIGLAIAYPFLG